MHKAEGGPAAQCCSANCKSCLGFDKMERRIKSYFPDFISTYTTSCKNCSLSCLTDDTEMTKGEVSVALSRKSVKGGKQRDDSL